MACVGAVGSAAHGTRTAAAARIPALPAQNARYLRLLLSRFQRTDLALAAYNAGPTVVTRLGRAPRPVTETYVANVQRRWAALAGCS